MAAAPANKVGVVLPAALAVEVLGGVRDWVVLKHKHTLIVLGTRVFLLEQPTNSKHAHGIKVVGKATASEWHGPFTHDGLLKFVVHHGEDANTMQHKLNKKGMCVCLELHDIEPIATDTGHVTFLSGTKACANQVIVPFKQDQLFVVKPFNRPPSTLTTSTASSASLAATTPADSEEQGASSAAGLDSMASVEATPAVPAEARGCSPARHVPALKRARTASGTQPSTGSGGNAGPLADPAPDRPDLPHGAWPKQELNEPVHSMKDAFAWADYALAVLEALQGPLKELTGECVATTIADRFREETISTSFSGIDAPFVAIEVICSSLRYKLGAHVRMPNNIFAIEWFAKSRSVLVRAPTPPRCIFEDISGFLRPAAKNVMDALENAGQMSFANVLPLIMTPGVINLEAQCTVHGGECRVGTAKCQVAGTPCGDYSKMGAMKKDQGKTMRHYAVWLAMRRELQEPTILHENVEGFDIETLKAALSDLYRVDTAVIDSSTLGWPVQRKRRITVLSHRKKTQESGVSIQQWYSMFQRVRKTSWKDLFDDDVDVDDLKLELAWASSRRSHKKGRSSDTIVPTGPVTPQHFFDVLTATEKEYLRTYQQIAPGAAFSLGQNPNVRPTTSKTNLLQTLIKNTGLLWSDPHGKWLSGYGCLAAQGFPIHPRHSIDGDVCTGFRDRSKVTLEDRTATVGQAGNSMNVTMIGLGVLFTVLMVKRNEDPLGDLRSLIALL